MSRSVQQDHDKARGKAKHVITITGGRVEIECQSCKSSMDVSGTSALGTEMLKNWPKLHKCPKELR